MKDAKVETRVLPGKTRLKIVLPNGDDYEIELHQDCIDIRSNNDFDGKCMIIRSRVSNEVRVMATELQTITP